MSDDSKANWPEVCVGDICEFRYGKSLPEPTRRLGSVAVFGSNGAVGWHDQPVSTGPTLVVGRKGSFGEVHFSDGPCWPIDTTYFIDRVQANIDLRWLFYRLRGVGLKDLNRAAAVPGLNREDAYRQRLLLPPLPEQRRIAEVLDRAETLRAQRRQALAQLDVLAEAIFLDMFGDPTGNPRLWQVQPLGELATGKPNNGIFRKNEDYTSDTGQGLPVVWVEELFRGRAINTAASRRLQPTGSEIAKYGLCSGDLLFCRSSLKRDGIAFSNVYLGPDAGALFECHVIRLTPDTAKVVPAFLNSQLRLPSMREVAKSWSKTSTMTTIDQGSLCSIAVVVPPIDLQRRFAALLSAIDNMATVHRAQAAHLTTLFTSLQHRAFRGEL